MDEVGAKKQTRLSTGVEDEAAATEILLNACQSSRVESHQLYGITPKNVDFFDFLALRASSIFLKSFCMGKRTLSEDVTHDKVLRVLQIFAELKTIGSRARKDTNLQDCLIRSCFKVGVTLNAPLVVHGKRCEIPIVEDAVMDFCFGECDEEYATRTPHDVLLKEFSLCEHSIFLKCGQTPDTRRLSNIE